RDARETDGHTGERGGREPLARFVEDEHLERLARSVLASERTAELDERGAHLGEVFKPQILVARPRQPRGAVGRPLRGLAEAIGARRSSTRHRADLTLL